jgi:hypothetical protein
MDLTTCIQIVAAPKHILPSASSTPLELNSIILNDAYVLI